MKYIKLFVASSIDTFEREWGELKSYISSLNDIYVRRDIYFDLILCENLSNALDKERKQAAYNAEIRKCQYFYVIFAEKSANIPSRNSMWRWSSSGKSGALPCYASRLNITCVMSKRERRVPPYWRSDSLKSRLRVPGNRFQKYLYATNTWSLPADWVSI